MAAELSRQSAGKSCGCGRRTVLKAALTVGALAAAGLAAPSFSFAAFFSKEQRDKLTPDDIVDLLKQGNDRFRSGKMLSHDYLAQKRATASGQYPGAAILSCIDSRAPAEIVFDTEIGETFNARVAGNVANDDLIGSLEFACAAAGAKVVLVMGHTSCGAIKGAIDSVQLGKLTGLLDKIKPAVAATQYEGDRSSKNDAFVDAVARTNVQRTVDEIRHQSDILAGYEKDKKIRIVGAMYHLVGGRVDFLG
ncbi:MAG TPA: carbonic anhydrase family protein [Roseiarcus sp.]|nr:carbonic anhydrase family protein [Roseiarcus sp.]